MDYFFAKYADLAALFLSFSLPVIVTIWIKRKTGNQTRAIPVGLLVFGPLGILSFIFFHLFENSYRAIAGALSGTFNYNFHFYSVILFGAVLATVAGYFLRSCVDKCLLQNFRNRVIFFYILLVVLVVVPLLPITPISAVPLICCVFSLSGLSFVRRKQKQTGEIAVLNNQAATG